MIPRSLEVFLSTLLVLVALLGTQGCSSLMGPHAPEAIRELHEPQTGAEYLLYRPSAYRSSSEWPLVIVCHSSLGDSPGRQMREWTTLAESSGFVVAAPRIDFERDYNPLDHDDPTSSQNVMERRILGTVRHVQASSSVSDDRVLIYGYGRGAEAALYVGLRHPDVFRAISLLTPDVDLSRLAGIEADPQQPVHVRARRGGLVKITEAIKEDPTTALLGWFTSNGIRTTIDSSTDVGREDAKYATEFFELTLRKDPWLHIEAFTPDPQKPLMLQFKARASFVPEHYDWRFPNGLTYNEAGPIYTFDAPGEYRVKLVVPSPVLSKKPIDLSRTVVVRVPGGQVRWQ